MGRRSSKTEPNRYEGDATALSSNPFAALARVEASESVNQAPPEPAPDPPRSQTEPPYEQVATDPFAADHLVVRKERKGHGGKTVTVVEGWTCSMDALEDIARRLRKTLGCSGRVDAGRVLLSGARQARVADWLRAAGARRVTIGN